MVEIGGLLFGQRGFAIEIAHVERALDIMLEAGTRIGDDPLQPSRRSAANQGRCRQSR